MKRELTEQMEEERISHQQELLTCQQNSKVRVVEGERAKRASLLEDEHTRDEVREMARKIMATSTTKLTYPIRLARSVCFARPSL